MNFDQESIDAKLKAMRDAQALMDKPPALRKVCGSKSSIAKEVKDSARIAVAILKSRAKKREEDAKRPPEPIAIKPVDLSGKVSLKINHKTTIFIPIGADPAKYLAKYKKEVDSTKKRLEHMQQQLGYTYQF